MLSGNILVLGGAASGKSSHAESLLNQRPEQLIYLASAECYDDEMREKVNLHIARRGPRWTTMEEPLAAADVIAALEPGQICLFDCATLWLSNHMLADSDIAHEEEKLLAALDASAVPVVTVSNEVGQGIVPDTSLGRRFREAQGRLNIALAAQATQVIHVVAGIPRTLKGDAL